MAGQILGDRYKVEKQLGSKSGRWTLLATDITNESPAILKLISMDDELHPDVLRLFDREINILKSLNHPALPRYLDYFEIDLPKEMKALVLVQSYIEGVSIDRYIRKGRVFSEQEARNISKAILKILAYLHGHDPCIVHRDIKPSNILLVSPPDKKSKVCLVDLGSVKQIASRPSNTTVLSLVGDENYMAPEQLGGRAVLSSDLYSLGLTMFTLLTGLEPAELPKKGMVVDAQSISQCSSEFAQWLSKMTEPTMQKRFPTVDDALAALQQI
ncbi:MAG: serine/threonine-protein kinase [Elainellaceae cyanobacterium]